jgi:hypothetical protein
MNVGKIVVVVAVLVLFGTCAYAADCNSGGRYEDMGDGTVTDCRTGMIWLKNATCTETSNGIIFNPNGNLNWYDAMKWVAGLGDGLCGLSDGSFAGDWRLPTKIEWMAMVAYAKSRYSSPPLTNGAGDGHWTSGDVFTNVQSNAYWSSTSYPNFTNYAWEVNTWVGSMGSNLKSYESYCWPVRGGQSGSFGFLTIE